MTSDASLTFVKELPEAICARAQGRKTSSLTTPLFFLSEHQAQIIRTKNLTLLLPYVNFLPCWVPYEVVSRAMGYSEDGIRARSAMLMKQAAKSNKNNNDNSCPPGVFCWCSEFENVHSTWNVVEPGFDITWKTLEGNERETTTTIRFHGSEQFFQLCKVGPIGSPEFIEHAPRFAKATDLGAFSLGRSVKLRPDWEDVKNEMMVMAVREKFRQNDQLKQLLLSTHPLPLASIKSDSYWGCGTNGWSGRNQLGVTLMRVRRNLSRRSIDRGERGQVSKTCQSWSSCRFTEKQLSTFLSHTPKAQEGPQEALIRTHFETAR